jgi:hypothetical protein
MSTWYSICGWVRVRKCAEVEDILRQLGDRCGQGIKIDVSDVETDQLEISVEGGSLFPKGTCSGSRNCSDRWDPSHWKVPFSAAIATVSPEKS